MILISRPPDVPTPPPIQTLDDDLIAFLQRPYEDGVTTGGDFSIANLAPSNPVTRDRLLGYAYAVYDTFVSRQFPTRSTPSAHTALLLPLLELLHGLHPHNSPVALLLGCVYHHHNLIQRSLQINRHILQHDPDNVSAMCNLGVNLRLMNFPVEAFEYWWRALQLSPINWDILDNMLETFLGSNSLGGTSPAVFDEPTSHVLQTHRQALQMCNFVLGHLPENPVRKEEVHRAQNTFCRRALLLRSLQEVGEWADLVDGIEIGINTLALPRPFLPVDSIRPRKATLDDLLLQIHSIGMSIRDKTNRDISSRDRLLNPRDAFPTASVEYGSLDPLPSPEASGWRMLQPTLLLFPQETLRLPRMLWPSTQGSLPSIAPSTIAEILRDDTEIERLKALTNVATSRLLRTWAMRVQDLPEFQPPTTQDDTLSATVPGSVFHATKSLAILADYLALSLSPTAMSYNDLGILLSSLDTQPSTSRSSGSSSSGVTTGHNLSRVYFEAGLEAEPYNAHLLTNLGSYWRKEGNYEEAIRYYQLSLTRNPEFAVARIYLERTLEEIECAPLHDPGVVLTPLAGRISKEI
ncbi:TPR-like protein [Thelephora ganbajun]|uniref:TPR-like protein n=1 Tax=Thelephora ganbajun TaxID=370292 RepID=A0ACB6Z8R3_THEGA|nr:TPR-like protein [Thelephora ganbajun]